MKTEFLKQFIKDIEKDIVEFARVVHRKDIYKVFP
jgi:hypothetical protein